MTAIENGLGGYGLNGLGSLDGVGRGQERGLRREGNTINAGRYEITIRRDEVIIRDRINGEHSRIWGDPHLHTGDGDRASFTNDNLTLDLPGGVKITIKPTAPDANGASWIDQVGVMYRDKGMIARGVHDGAPVFTGEMSSATVDQLLPDGTVLHTNGSIDDWIFADGTEMTGGDANARWGEHNLDGRGGVSRNNFSLDGELQGGGDVYDRLYAVLAKLEQMKNSQLGRLTDLLQRKEKKEKLENDLQKLRESGSGPESPEVVALERQIENVGNNLEADLQKAQLELQRTQSLISQTTTLLTNLIATDGQNALSIIRNIRAG